MGKSQLSEQKDPLKEQKEYRDLQLNNKFVKIRIIADRVRQLEMGAPAMVESKGNTLMELAIEELKQGKIQIFANDKSASALLALPIKEEAD
ncbi:MAG: DNA-directed RNA polymerase subunit omega [Nitrospinae bacterium]|nr:DNA-directed RNA polymerase subunit omega [Nitrospinota bacterium]